MAGPSDGLYRRISLKGGYADPLGVKWTTGRLGERPMRFTSCQRFAWSAMCLWGACAVLGSCSKDLTTINMSEPAAAKPAGKKEDLRPVLKVAIGALVSPEPTRELYYDLVTLIGSRAGMRAAFAQRRTYAEVNHLLATEKADIAFVCSGPYVWGHDECPGA